MSEQNFHQPVNNVAGRDFTQHNYFSAPRLSHLEQRHRKQLLKQMRLDWIDGVLCQSLYKLARLELGFTNKADAVEQPLNAVVRVPGHSPKPIPPGTRISQIFDEQAGALLIVGAPGTGKTTLLLELAQHLLDRADHDESQPIPVVFPLSSWATRQQPLADWLIKELNQRSYVPKKVARQWIEAEQILPLLDGLDEVAAEYRQSCLEAINQFRREYGLLPIAVCSRTTDYEALGTKLRLRTAVEIQPLAKHQVEESLVRVGESLRGLRAAIEEDASLWELLETPLMLWVAMLTYRDLPLASSKGHTVEQRQQHLFAQFVEAMFQRKASQGHYMPEQTKHWLSRLAKTLTRNNQPVFYLENIDYSWLPTRTQQWLARVVATVITVLLIWLSVMLSFAMEISLRFGTSAVPKAMYWAVLHLWSPSPSYIGLLLGLGIGLVSIVIRIQPVDNSAWGWVDLRQRMNTALRSGLLCGLLFTVLGGLLIALGSDVHVVTWSDGLISGLIWMIGGGLGFGLRAGFIVGVVRLLTYEAAAETRSHLNQGTHKSIKMMLLGGLFGGGIFGLSSGFLVNLINPTIRLSNGLIIGLNSGLITGLSNGLAIGLIVGLLSGGLFAVKHFILRLTLWLSGFAPLNYVAFLTHAKDLLFLRQVGGGYNFTHRLLQEYFASLSQKEKEAEPRTKATSAA